MPTVTMTTPELESFIEGCRKIVRSTTRRWGYQGEPKKLHLEEGRRYIKVVRDTSAWAFIDKTNGDVLKVASWSKPAKHARGNIFDEHKGLEKIGPYGPAYLRG